MVASHSKNFRNLVIVEITNCKLQSLPTLLTRETSLLLTLESLLASALEIQVTLANLAVRILRN